MDLKQIKQLMIITGDCRQYGIPLWQCPQFLFLVMGFIILVSSTLFYMLAGKFIRDPQVVAMMILGLAAFLFALSFVISKSFERLAEANRMKSEFVGIASQQLRTPLTNLGWALDYLMGQGDKKKQALTAEERTEYMNILKENIERMQDLVNRLLVVSRVEEGRLALQKEKFHLPQLIENAVESASSFIAAANVKVKIEGEKEMPDVESDRMQIRQEVSNLLDNAIRYAMIAGDEKKDISRQAQITIRYGVRSKNMYVEIEDNGIGIALADQKFIFRKFFRGRNALRHQTQGSGLGLYIIKSIVKEAGGDMGFQSQENKGSMFWFTLPLQA